MVDIVEAEAALDAEPVAVRRPSRPSTERSLSSSMLIGDLAADAAIGADAIDRAVGACARNGRRASSIVAGMQRAGRTGLDAFAAGNAGAVAHRVVEVEHDLVVGAAAGHADHVVDLHLAAGPHAQSAFDAGVEMDRHRRMAAVGRGLMRARGKAALRRRRPGRPSARSASRDRAPSCAPADRRPAARTRACAATAPARWPFGPSCPAAGLRMHEAASDALALDLDHAGAAIAVGAIAGRRRVSRDAADLDAARAAPLARSVSPGSASTSTPSSWKAMGFALTLPPSLIRSSSRHVGRKMLQHQLTGFIAAWPRPQIEASVITRVSSASRRASHVALGQQLHRLLGADAAGRALAAALILEEFEEIERHEAHVVLVRQHDHRGRADEAAIAARACRNRAARRPCPPAGCRPRRRPADRP